MDCRLWTIDYGLFKLRVCNDFKYHFFFSVETASFAANFNIV